MHFVADEGHIRSCAAGRVCGVDTGGRVGLSEGLPQRTAANEQERRAKEEGTVNLMVQGKDLGQRIFFSGIASSRAPQSVTARPLTRSPAPDPFVRSTRTQFS